MWRALIRASFLLTSTRNPPLPPLVHTPLRPSSRAISAAVPWRPLCVCFPEGPRGAGLCDAGSASCWWGLPRATEERPVSPPSSASPEAGKKSPAEAEGRDEGSRRLRRTPGCVSATPGPEFSFPRETGRWRQPLAAGLVARVENCV